jgi:lauroyl/myristoyl acyltransferase
MMSAGFFARGYALYGVDSIPANSGVRAYAKMLAAVRRGGIVFVTIDQGVKRPADGIPVRFLGKTMAVAAGPAHLAQRGRTPVLPVATLAADGAWRFRIEPPLPPAAGPLAADVERLAQVSERQVLLHPELWSWHHRRWRKQAFASCDNSVKRDGGAVGGIS